MKRSPSDLTSVIAWRAATTSADAAWTSAPSVWRRFFASALLVFALILGYAPASQAQVAQLGTSTSLYQSTAGASHSLGSVTVPAGSNRVLIVTASHAGFQDVASVSFGGTPMTKAIERDDGSVAVDSIWFLVLGSAPGSTAGTVVAQFATPTTTTPTPPRESFLAAATFSGVDQGTPVSASNSTNDTGVGGPNLGSSLTLASAAGDLVLDVFDGFRSTGPVTPNVVAGQTLLASGGGAITGTSPGQAGYRVSTKPGAAPNVTVGWTSNSEAMIHVAVNLRASASAPASAPTVSSPTSTAVTSTSATLGGNVTADGGASISARGVVLSPTATNNNPLIGGSGVINLTTTGTTGVFTLNATSLAPNTAYSFKAYATNSAGTGYSSIGTFATPCPATVVTNGNDSGAGSLRQVIADACAGSTITFAPGVNTVTLTTAVLFSQKTLTIDGGANRVTITRSTAPGTPDFGVIYFQISTLTLSNLIIGNGRSSDFGGGVYVNTGNLIINDSIIRGNTVLGAQGGGIAVVGGTLTMNRTLVEGNQGVAAGIYVQDSAAVISGSTIRDNSGSGAGIRFTTGGNQTFQLISSTISDNVSPGGESALLINSGGSSILAATVINSTITRNVTTAAGGSAIISTVGNISLSLTNSIVSGNLSGGVAADSQLAFAPSSTNNLIGVGGGLTNGANGNIVGVTNPRVSASGDFGGPVPTVALLPGSPAINAGSSCVLTANGCSNSNPALLTDQRGIARVGAVDIGAFESRGFTLAIEGGNNQVASPGTAFAQPLAVRVAPVASGEPVEGGAVSYTAPGSGASATLASNPATINASGVASTAATANATTGAYTVGAAANGASPALSFALQNQCPATVVTNGNDSGAGSLRQVIADACPGSTITFAGGVTTVGLTTAQLLINKNLIIDGGAGVTVTRVAGSPDFRIFLIASGNTVTLDSLTMTNGRANVGGVIGNQGNLSILDAVISGGLAGADGGGIYSVGGVLQISNSTISGNSAANIGGGIMNVGFSIAASATIINTSIIDNRAAFAAGIQNQDGTLSLSNCTIANNEATGTDPTGDGAGLVNVAAGFVTTATVTNCTFNGNRQLSGAANAADEVYSGNFGTQSTVTLKNTILGGSAATATSNLALHNGGVITSQGNNLSSDSGAGVLTGPGDLINTDPLLAPLTNYGGTTQTLALLPGSPAINAGNTTGAPTTDQRGVARVGAVDMGAFESRGYTLAIEGGNNQVAGPGVAFAQPLAVRVAPVAAGEPVSGGAVSFTAPGSGASATLASNPASINGSGVAATVATANATTGSYTVSAAANGASAGVDFALRNAAATVSVDDVTVTEGDTGTVNAVFTVTRSNRDTAFSVNYATAGGTATSGTDFTATSGTLSFAAGPAEPLTRTVTVPVIGDRIDEANEQYTLTLSGLTQTVGTTTLSMATGTGTITDDDTAGITTNPTVGLVTTEAGGTASFTVVLNSQPTANVILGFISDDPSEGTASPNSLTFTSANWNVPQTVTVTGVDDLIVDGDIAYSIETTPATSADPIYDGINPADISVSNTDNDVPGVTVTPTTGLTTTEAGGTATFTVVLSTQPTADVTIGLSSSDTTEGTVAPTSLTFTSANWNTARTVTVTGVDDLIDDGNVSYTIVTAAATSTDPNYAGLNAADVSVSNTDNDEAGVILTESSGTTAVAEGGATDTYTLVLTSQPTANVVVTMTPSAQVTTAPTSVTFTSANWNTPQTVTVTAVDDAVVEGAHGGTVGHTVSSADTAYDGAEVAVVEVGITDNDNAGVTVTQSGGNTAVTEGGVTDTYTLVLTSQPTANVTVAVNPNAQLTTAPTSVTFTSATWNTPQTVTVTAVDDAVAEGAHAGTVAHTVTSADANYNGVSVAGITATITDNDNAGVTVAQSGGSTAVTEGGATDTYTLVLTSQPTANVTVAINPNAQLTTAPTSVTFTSANWNQPQTVTVTAVDDVIAEGTHSGSVAHTVSSADGNYNGTSVAGITATITDNDNPGVTVAQSGGNTAVTEGGATDTYTLVLTSQPTANVVIALTSGTQLTATPTSVTFTSANWNVAQTVTVTAVDDAIAEGTHNGSVTHAVTSADANYQGRLVDSVSATITDNDAAGVQVTQSGGNTAVTEGAAPDTVSVVLSSQPVADVTVTITPNAQLTATPSPLVFTSANWATPQVVSVTAADDVVVEGNHSGTLGFGVASTDPAYGSITLPSITAAVTDNDTAVVSFAPASVSQSEATSPMVYAVTLSNPVASGVTVKVNSTNGTATAGADYTAVVDQTVTFAANSTTAQTVSVAVTNDALDEDNETYSLTLSALSATGDVSLGTATATGTIEDDDALPTLSVANVTQPEGNAVNTLNFTVTLSPVSGRAVSFTRATVDGTAISTGADADFVAIAGSMVTIPAGETSVTIPVTINGDTTFEGDEQFTLSLTDIANAAVGGTTIAGSVTTLSATATLTEDDQQPTTTTITADLPDPSVVGQPYPVTVEVRAQTLSPLGSVTITDGTGASCNTPLTAGTAPVSSMTCTLTSTSAGAKTLTASYTPASEAFAASSDTEAHTVNAAATSLVLLGPARARIGTAATYTAELSVTAPGAGTPAGIVTVSAGANSCTITLPTATPSCTITYSTLGSRSVSAVFAPGNGDYAGSTATPVQTLVFASADLSVTKTNAVGTYRPGDLLVYTVVVRNTGPDAAPQVRIRDVAPAGLTNVAWTCEASGGAICPDAGGTGTLDHVVETLPTGGVLTYAYFGNVIGRPLSLVNTAEVLLPADTTIEDPNLANNSATDTDLLDDLFADGFEAPGINAEAGGVRLPAASLRSTLDEVARVSVRLSDVRGEALRVYARVIGGELQVALALRGADGALRLGAWQRSSSEPELMWTAAPVAGGFVLSGASLR